MTRITNTDQVLALLRTHLQRSQRTQRTPVSRNVRQAPLKRIQKMARVEELSDAEIRRALISGILEEELGEAVANDAKFQQTVSDVLRVIEEDKNARGILERAIVQLKAG